MAYSFPLTRNAFFATLPIAEQTFELQESLEISRLADGSVLRDDLGARLWHGSVVVDRMTFAQAGAIEAKLAMLQGAGGSFRAWRIDSAYPDFDPDGSLLTGFSPQISQLAANAREMALSGLPVGYKLRPGDFVSFGYGSNPIRRALHRIVSDEVTASAAGQTPLFEVIPHISPGATLTTAVELKRPYINAVVVPGSVRTGTSRGSKSRGLSFEFMQTMRV